MSRTKDGERISGVCPKCKSDGSVRYYHKGGVAFFTMKVKRREDRASMQDNTVAVIGIPTLACTVPGCLWSVAHPFAETPVRMVAGNGRIRDAVRQFPSDKYRDCADE